MLPVCFLDLDVPIKFESGQCSRNKLVKSYWNAKCFVIHNLILTPHIAKLIFNDTRLIWIGMNHSIFFTTVHWGAKRLLLGAKRLGAKLLLLGRNVQGLGAKRRGETTWVRNDRYPYGSWLMDLFRRSTLFLFFNLWAPTPFLGVSESLDEWTRIVCFEGKSSWFVLRNLHNTGKLLRYTKRGVCV